MSELFQFLKPGSEATIRDGNPWWRNERIYNLPVMRRWAFDTVLGNLKQGLTPDRLDEFPNLADLAGHIAESTAGYFLRTINGLDVAHFPARTTEPEVDFVLTIGEQRIPVEVKYRARIDHQDTVGLRSFMEKAHYNAHFGILVTSDEEVASDDPRIVSLHLSSLLLLR